MGKNKKSMITQLSLGSELSIQVHACKHFRFNFKTEHSYLLFEGVYSWIYDTLEVFLHKNAKRYGCDTKGGLDSIVFVEVTR